MIRRYLLFLALLAGSVTGGAWLMNASSPAPGAGQDLKFPHGKHVTELSMACADCHVLATATAPAAMRPGHDNCTSCHETQVTSECAYCHTDPENIPPAGGRTSDLIFPHEIHVPAGGGCDGCHAGIATAAAGVSVPGPTMETCYTCHNDVAQSNACELCHRNFAMLLPPDHRVADFAHKHRDETRLGALAVECRTCHTETFCQECHQGTGLKNFTTRDRMTDPRPRTSTQDAPDQTVLQSVHGLNYRFTHGIDARARESECLSCHTQQTFCADCHAAGGNLSQGSFKPASHFVAGYATLTPGLRGGLHAAEARRDLESCMSCHNAEGQDPVCTTCHAGR
jgi:predicted CXXCH cytochrome family protein